MSDIEIDALNEEHGYPGRPALAPRGLIEIDGKGRVRLKRRSPADTARKAETMNGREKPGREAAMNAMAARVFDELILEGRVSDATQSEVHALLQGEAGGSGVE